MDPTQNKVDLIIDKYGANKEKLVQILLDERIGAEDVDLEPGSVPPWVDLTELVKIRHFDNGIAVINPCNWIIDVPLGGAYYDIESWNGEFYEYRGLTTSLELSCQRVFTYADIQFAPHRRCQRKGRHR